jgi:hypothetical protein
MSAGDGMTAREVRFIERVVDGILVTLAVVFTVLVVLVGLSVGGWL